MAIGIWRVQATETEPFKQAHFQALSQFPALCNFQIHQAAEWVTEYQGLWKLTGTAALLQEEQLYLLNTRKAKPKRGAASLQ